MRLSLWRLPLVFFAPADAGAGGGVVSPGGKDGTAPVAGAATETGGAVPFALSDDAMVRLSDGRTVRYGDYHRELQSTADTEARSRYQRGYELLLNEAKRIDALTREGGGRRETPTDPFADIRNLPVVDGPTLMRLYDQLQSAGLGPIAQVVAALQRQLQETRGQLQHFSQRFGSDDEERESSNFERTLDDVLARVEIKGLQGKLDARSEPIRQFARNLYLSYVPTSWKAGEFERQLAAEFSALVTAIRDADRASVEDGRRRLKEHFNPDRGRATPSGEPRYEFESGRTLAARAREAGMFGGSRT